MIKANECIKDGEIVKVAGYDYKAERIKFGTNFVIKLVRVENEHDRNEYN